MFIFVAVVSFLLSLRGAFFVAVVAGRVFFLLSSPGAFFVAVVAGRFFGCCRCGGAFCFCCSFTGFLGPRNNKK